MRRIALIADTFPPLRTSGAVQLRDLSREFVRQGYALTVILPNADAVRAYEIEDVDGTRVVRLSAPKTKDVGYVRRTVSEFMMPFAMLRNIRRSPLKDETWDAVIWYSPSIFLGPLVQFLKTRSRCSAYLILRDIFPDWAVHMGLMRRSAPYWFFKAVERYQYSVADVIGVQTAGNLEVFRGWLHRRDSRKVEVLQNWLADGANRGCSIDVQSTSLAGRKVFVYAGNMGVAQGLDILIDLAERLRPQRDVGFLFVGRGSEVRRLSSLARSRQLDNVLFLDEISPDEIPGLYAQCAVGLLALDPRHKTHNIPGKFLTYLQAGLPVLASINPGNDLESLILVHDVGHVSTSNSPGHLYDIATQLIKRINNGDAFAERCRRLFLEKFSPETAASQIVRAVTHGSTSPGVAGLETSERRG